MVEEWTNSVRDEKVDTIGKLLSCSFVIKHTSRRHEGSFYDAIKELRVETRIRQEIAGLHPDHSYTSGEFWVTYFKTLRPEISKERRQEWIQHDIETSSPLERPFVRDLYGLAAIADKIEDSKICESISNKVSTIFKKIWEAPTITWVRNNPKKAVLITAGITAGVSVTFFFRVNSFKNSRCFS